MATAVQEPKQETTLVDNGAASIGEMFPTNKGWRNVNLFGRVWRCNRWEVKDFSGSIAESHFVTVTSDELVIE
jgi:hypothetical protein